MVVSGPDSGRVFGGMGDFLGAKDEAVEFVLNWMNMLMLQKMGSVEAPQKNEFSHAKCALSILRYVGLTCMENHAF